MMKKGAALIKERGYKGEKKELLWIFLTTVAVLAVIALIANFTPSGLTGHFLAVQNIAYLKAGSELPMAVKNIKGMYLANFELLDDIKGGQITFQEDDSLAFDGIAYSKFVVASADEDKIGEIRITMKIRQADLKGIGLIPEKVTLYVNGKEAVTRIDHTEGEYEYYTASTDELGEYVIGRMREEEVSQEPLAPPSIAPAPAEESAGQEIPAEREPAPVEEEIGFWARMVNSLRKIFN